MTDAEQKGPGNNKPEPEASDAMQLRARKEPPMIDGEAEVLSEGAPSSTASRAEPFDITDGEDPNNSAGKSGGSGHAIGLPLLGGLVGALVLLALAYALGLSSLITRNQDAAIVNLGTRVSALDKTLGESSTAMQVRVEGFDTRLSAAEHDLAEQAQSPDTLGAVNTRLDRMTADTQTLQKSLGETSEATKTAGQKLDAIAAAMPPADLAERINRLEEIVKALNLALTTLAPKVDDMATQIAALEAKRDDPNAAERAALALALANLTRAMEAGQAFKPELDTVRDFLPNEAELAKLQTVADTGLVSEAGLKQQFPQLMQSIFDAERHADARSYWSKFWGNATSLITIRRTGEISGTTTEAILARMEERLKIDDLAGAVVQVRELKGAAARAASSWVAAAQARLDADIEIRALTARITAQLAAAKG